MSSPNLTSSSSSSSSSSSEVPMVTLAGVSIPLADAIVLKAIQSGANSFTTLQRNGASYQVPVGYKLVIYAIRAQVSGGATEAVGVGYGDTSVQGVAAVNPVYFYGGPAAASFTAYAALWGGINTNKAEAMVYGEVPAGKYPFIFSVAGNNVYVEVIGKLEVA